MEVTRRDQCRNDVLKAYSFEKTITAETPTEMINVRRETLAARWAKFEVLHDAVLARAGPDEMNEHQSIYDTTEEYYFKAISRFDGHLKTRAAVTPTAVLPSIAATKTESRPLQLKHQQAALCMFMKDIEHFAEENGETAEEGAVLAQQRNLEKLYEQTKQMALERISYGENDVAVMADLGSMQTSYLRSVTLLHTALNRFSATGTSQSTTGAANNIKLPTLQISPFDGSPDKWEAFRDSFAQGFHIQQSMPSVQKLQHLKGFLRGEAEELIQNFPLTGTNYEAAWNLLNDRYDNPKVLVQYHLKNLTSMPKCNESADDLRRLMNKTACSLRSLTNMGRPTDKWDDFIVFIVVERVDSESRKLWEQSQAISTDFPTWSDLEAFLQGRVRSLSAIGQICSASYAAPRQKSQKSVRTHQVATKNTDGCPCCTQDHALFFCSDFKRLTVDERRKIVSSSRRCYNCLGEHMMHSCTSNRRCRYCEARHNSLLHPPNQTNGAGCEIQQLTSNVGISSQPLANKACQVRILLATALVDVYAANGSRVTLRALLDQGSQASFISEQATQTLCLPRKRADVCVYGIGASKSQKAHHVVQMQLMSRMHTGLSVLVSALVLPVVTRLQQLDNVSSTQWSHLEGLTLADPDFRHQHKVDLLLGADVFAQLIVEGVRHGPPGTPTAQNTTLGWILSGKVQLGQSISGILDSELACHNSTIDMDLIKFWQLEEVPEDRNLAPDEVACEKQYEETVQRDSNGRYVVRLPINVDVIELGESHQMAISRQLQLERKFKAHPEFAANYVRFMEEYLSLGHMELVDNKELFPAISAKGQRAYHIPHHAVLKESSSTTKLRVVFDASRKTTNGRSLNEQLHIGPRLQQDLTSIVLRWRRHPVVFAADIEKMYRQIQVHPVDCDLQRIVWRADPSQYMRTYRLKTVTYGMTSAPYLAIRTLRQLAADEYHKYPLGAAIVLRDFYVDDVLSGADTEAEALMAQHQLVSMMSTCGFTLRKWASNSDALLKHMPSDHLECKFPLDLHIEQTIKTLGVQWNPASDDFGYRIQLPMSVIPPTKRSLLSDSAHMFDPLGWLAPVIVVIKLMFQKLWRESLEWDDALSEPLAKEWLLVRSALVTIGQIRVPRWIGHSKCCEVQLHGFCDASVLAYAACVYTRITREDGTVQTSLLYAKTKVAPIKTVSLPRLELCGAVLLAKLMHQTAVAMNFEKTPSIYCWTDSTIVLAWLRDHPTRWNVFVANRVSEIQRLYPSKHWSHVVSDENSADCASRGLSPEELRVHPLWWNGPHWLQGHQSSWPSCPNIAHTVEESRGKNIVINHGHIICWQLLNESSNWQRLYRVTAHCMRFCHNAKSAKADRKIGPLNVEELQKAQWFWIRCAQHESYPCEISKLSAGSPILKSSVLRALNPQLNKEGLLCVGGRLVNALSLPEQTRTPFIIPRRSSLSRLLIANAHMHTYHGGPNLMLANLRRTYWIVDGPREVRSYVHRCITCFRYTCTTGRQFMGALPAARVTASAKAFLHTAMDYSGAIQVRSSKGRGHHASKGYIALFVCLATKAVHIEVVTDLTSDAFIAAYVRFTSRRGACSDLYCDNGTNFVGASGLLKKAERQMGIDNKTQDTVATMGTKWHFSPPHAPHFNGLAEAGIRSVKYHLRRIIGDNKLTYEELCTVTARVEACLNSRPLYSMSTNPEDFDVLTPGHLLIGQPLLAMPEPNLLDHKTTALTRWQLTRQMFQRFWMKWSVQYLQTLQQRRKWQHAEKGFVIGDMVLLREDYQQPSQWALGRVIDIHPGPDGHVRVVTVRTRTSTFKRAIVKLARLPMDV